jgi:hypothetical protein
VIYKQISSSSEINQIISLEKATKLGISLQVLGVCSPSWLNWAGG